MPKSPSDRSTFRQIYSILPSHRRREAFSTTFLMIVGALADLISIGAVFPFLAILTDRNPAHRVLIFGNLEIRPLLGLDLASTITVIFIGLLLISGAVRLLLSWKTQALAFNTSYDMTVLAFRKLIHQPYRFYLDQSSSEALSSFEKIQTITYSVLLAGLQAFVATLLSTLIIGFLFIIQPMIAAVAAGALIGAYVIAILAVRNTLSRNSKIIASCWADRVRKVQEALGGIRDILLDRSQPVFESDFDCSARRVTRALAVNAFIGGAPRIVVEVIGMTLVGIVAWLTATQAGGLEGAIPTLGAMAIGAQRLLPLLQTAYNGWSSLLGSSQSIGDVLALLRLPEDQHGKNPTALSFQRSIDFRDVGFGYSASPEILHQIDLSIAKGERVGIVGKTGAGKSTLTDLLLGLLEPTSGEIAVDDVVLDAAGRNSWQERLGHVPQNIYLSDDTLAANIGFGIPRDGIDMARVAEAAKSAGIHDFIASLPEGYQTGCGERGVRLSGGQRQRIGIARALYKRPAVLILDEATSALDHATERDVMNSIDNLPGDVTVVMVAHRVTTLAGCNRIVSLEGGRIAAITDSISGIT